MLNHSYVGTEHILLGRCEGVAARVLKSLNIDVERCRNEVLSELDPNFSGEVESSTVSASSEEERKSLRLQPLRLLVGI